MDAAPVQRGDGCPECGTALLRGARFCHGCGWDSRNPAAGRAAAVTARSAYGRPAWKRRTMAAITAFSLALFLVLILRPAEGGVRELVPGTPAPDFTLETLDGRRLSLADLRGKYVVLNFWASWCRPCRQEMPALEQVWNRYRERNVVVLGVNFAEAPVTVRSFAEEMGITFPILLDRQAEVTQLYRIIPLPTTFFIGPDGKIQYRQQGEMSPELADLLTRRLLGDL